MKYVLALILMFVTPFTQAQVVCNTVFSDGFDPGPVTLESCSGPTVNIVPDQTTPIPSYEINYFNGSEQGIIVASLQMTILRNLQISNPFINPVLVQMVDANGVAIGAVPTTSTLTVATNPYYDITFTNGIDIPAGSSMRLLVSTLAKTVMIPVGAPLSARSFWLSTGPTDTAAFFNNGGMPGDSVILQGPPGPPYLGWILFYPP